MYTWTKSTSSLFACCGSHSTFYTPLYQYLPIIPSTYPSFREDPRNTIPLVNHLDVESTARHLHRRHRGVLVLRYFRSRCPSPAFADKGWICSPLCVEELDIQDKNFKPCPCGYQVRILQSLVCCYLVLMPAFNDFRYANSASIILGQI